MITKAGRDPYASIVSGNASLPTDDEDRADADGYRVDHDPGDDVELGTAVTRAVADAYDVAPEDVEEHLYDNVDPDGLDRIFAPKQDGTLRRGSCVVLALEGCEVTIESDGTVTVVT